MGIQKALEDNGFKVRKYKGYYEVQQHTPAGEDWLYEVHSLKDMIEIMEEYDPEEDFGVWMEARYHGNRDIPSPSELWKDQLWKQELFKKVLQEV